MMLSVRGSGLCVVFLRKTVNIHSASSYPGKPDQINSWG